MSVGSVDYTKKTPLYSSDIVDNLSSNLTNLPLSANQGSILNNKISKLEFNVMAFPVNKPGWYRVAKFVPGYDCLTIVLYQGWNISGAVTAEISMCISNNIAEFYNSTVKPCTLTLVSRSYISTPGLTQVRLIDSGERQGTAGNYIYLDLYYNLTHDLFNTIYFSIKPLIGNNDFTLYSGPAKIVNDTNTVISNLVLYP